MKRLDPKNLTCAQRRDPDCIGVVLEDIIGQIRAMNTRAIRETVYNNAALRDAVAHLVQLALYLGSGAYNEELIARLKAQPSQ